MRQVNAPANDRRARKHQHFVDVEVSGLGEGIVTVRGADIAPIDVPADPEGSVLVTA